MPLPSRALTFLALASLGGCASDSPSSGRWAGTSADDYPDYCTIEFCDAIETAYEPECDCPCVYDGDGIGDPDDAGDPDSDGSCGDGVDCGDGSGGGGGDGDGNGGGGGGDEACGDGVDCGDGTTDTPEASPSGCTLTQGYWKNHNSLRTNASQAIDWPAPLDEADLLCGKTLLDVLHIVPRGEAWYILAHQWVAASLNAANGAETDELDGALATAEALLTSHCDGMGDARDAAIELAYQLDSFNNGLIGPGHCGN